MTENAEMPNETEDRQRILLADDEASIRRILETRLKMVGYDVYTAQDGEDYQNAVHFSIYIGISEFLIYREIYSRTLLHRRSIGTHISYFLPTIIWNNIFIIAHKHFPPDDLQRLKASYKSNH